MLDTAHSDLARQGASAHRRLVARLRLAAMMVALAAAVPACGGNVPNADAGSPSAGYLSTLNASAQSCIDIKAPRGQLISGQPVVRVRVGTPFTVQFVVSEREATGTFPWETPASTDSGVIRQEDFCKPGVLVTSLPESYTLFVAVSVGHADIVAPLNPGWSPPGGAAPLSPYRVTVDVSA